jgi:hypothetical protein
MIETAVSSSAFLSRPVRGDALHMATRSSLGPPSSGALLACRTRPNFQRPIRLTYQSVPAGLLEGIPASPPQ